MESEIDGETVLLIHGAWQGSWVWDSFSPLLTDAGLDFIAADLPGNGSDTTKLEEVSLELYIEYLGKIIESRMPHRISLVAHSGSGVIATELAERFPERISRIAYVAGMMLPPGMCFSDLLTDMNAAENDLQGIETELVWSDDMSVSSVPPEHGAAIFLNDMDQARAYQAALNLTPQATKGLAISANWTEQRFGTVPRLYIECSQDLSVKLPVQKQMQKLVPGAESICLNTGHAPQASAPKLLADALIPFLKAAL